MAFRGVERLIAIGRSTAILQPKNGSQSSSFFRTKLVGFSKRCKKKDSQALGQRGAVPNAPITAEKMDIPQSNYGTT